MNHQSQNFKLFSSALMARTLAPPDARFPEDPIVFRSNLLGLSIPLYLTTQALGLAAYDVQAASPRATSRYGQ